MAMWVWGRRDTGTPGDTMRGETTQQQSKLRGGRVIGRSLVFSCNVGCPTLRSTRWMAGQVPRCLAGLPLTVIRLWCSAFTGVGVGI